MIKTRSKLTLPEFDYDLLGRSPLKEARTALRTTYTSSGQESESRLQSVGDDDKDPKYPKRSISKDGKGLREREVKRAKRVPGEDRREEEEEVRSTHVLADEQPFHSRAEPFSSRKPSSTTSLPPSGSAHPATSWVDASTRAQSAPVESSVPGETNRVTSRSPVKSGDNVTTVRLPLKTQTEDDRMKIMVSQTVDEDIIIESPASGRSSLPPSSPSSLPVLRTPVPERGLHIPTSPLTPLPPTPAPARATTSLYQKAAPEDEIDEVEASRSHLSWNPRTPSASSKIPRPVLTATFQSDDARRVPPKRGVVSRMKAKGGGATSESSATPSSTPTTKSSEVRAKTPLGEYSQPDLEQTPSTPHNKTPRPQTPIAESRAYVELAPQPTPSRSRTQTPRRAHLPSQERGNDSSVPSAELSEVERASNSAVPTGKGKSRLLQGSVDMMVLLNDTTDEDDSATDQDIDGRAPTAASNQKVASSSSLPATLVSVDMGNHVPSNTKPKKHSTTGTGGIPLGGRKTRSASLRQKKITETLTTGAAVTVGSKTAINGSAAANIRSTAPEMPSDAGPANARVSANRKRAMSVNSVTRPTFSSAAKANLSTPKKPRPPASAVTPSRPSTSMSTSSGTSGSSSRPASAMSVFRPSTSSVIPRSQARTNLSRSPHSATTATPSASKSTGEGGIATDAPLKPRSASSLSHLSLALAKLSALPPSKPNSSIGQNRPNTSLGFNREKNVDSANEEEASTGARKKTKVMSKDDTDVQTTARATRNSGAKERPEIKRASTVGPAELATLSEKKQSTLMLPPPVPRTRLASQTSDSEVDGTSRKKINLHSGMVTGKARGGFVFVNAASSSSKPRFGVAKMQGSMTGGRAHGHVVHRASKQTPLPVIEGSPVKPSDEDVIMTEEPGSTQGADDLISGIEENRMAGGSIEKGKGVDGKPPPLPGLDIEAIRAMVRDELGSDDSNGETGQGPSSPEKWRHNASRRASMASRLLSRSMSAAPETPPRRTPATTGKGKGRATSNVYPQSSVQQSAPGVLGQKTSTGARVSANTRRMTTAMAAASPNTSLVTPETTPQGTSESGSKSRQDKPLKILKGCRVFVDVKTEGGDEAGSLFVEMLMKMGAKVLQRVGQSCTHIVYKNGLMSTITRYRLLDDPKPLVIGVMWVVECVEQQKHLDETKYLVDLSGVGVAGTHKRRRSMLPKHLTHSEPEPRAVVSPVNHAGDSSADRSLEMQSSPRSEDGAANSSLDSDLPPLERARRKRNTLLNMLGR